MLHKIDRKGDLIANPVPMQLEREGKPRVSNYDDVIVKKPWGYEYLIFENEHVAIWMLHIVRKRKTSMHCHPGKKTGLVLLSGKATFYNLENSIELDPLDSLVIDKGAFHSTEASSSLPMTPHSENGILVMEIETPPLKTDLVRMKDEYGRAGAAYEGTDHMVFEPKECLKFQMPKNNEVIRKVFLDYVFTVRKGNFSKMKDLPAKDALVCLIGKKSTADSSDPYIRIGELVEFKDFYDNTKDKDLSNFTILTIERSEKLAKLSDFIFSYLAEKAINDVFMVCGGTAMHLVDSLGKNKDFNYITTHHEQAAAMAAEGYARISGRPSIVLVSSGPGATNAITGLYSAWIDSIPVIFISGQANTATLSRGTGLRQLGVEEADIVNLIKPITKYAAVVDDPLDIRYHLQKALYMATTGRPGPVWLDIPIDVQSKLINIHELSSFKAASNKNKNPKNTLSKAVSKTIRLLKESARPVLICGHGIRLSKAEEEFIQLANELKIPIISSWTASDLIPSDHQFYIGRSGIMGDRAGNFTVQNADLLLVIGSRLSIPQIGYNYRTFAREAKKIVVDIDEKELNKPSVKVDMAINCDAKGFINEMLRQLQENSSTIGADEWLAKCIYWKNKYLVCLPEYKEIKEKVNSFYFIDLLSSKLSEKAIVVTDVGTSIISTMQAFKTKANQRLFSSSGHGPMGFGLPGSIGASIADGKRKTICITGDGGLQMNIQELQTLVHYNLPIIIFVLNNNGYLTIKLMQQNHFGKYIGSDRQSGLSCPDIIKVADAYGIRSERILDHDGLHAKIDKVLSEPGPFICEILMAEDQLLIPRVSSMKRPDGSIISRPLEDLYPFLDRKEFLNNMIIKPVEILKE